MPPRRRRERVGTPQLGPPSSVLRVDLSPPCPLPNLCPSAFCTRRAAREGAHLSAFVTSVSPRATTPRFLPEATRPALTCPTTPDCTSSSRRRSRSGGLTAFGGLPAPDGGFGCETPCAEVRCALLVVTSAKPMRMSPRDRRPPRRAVLATRYLPQRVRLGLLRTAHRSTTARLLSSSPIPYLTLIAVRRNDKRTIGLFTNANAPRCRRGRTPRRKAARGAPLSGARALAAAGSR
jgi:hypothetical protein